MFRPVLAFLVAASAAFAQDDPAEGKNDEPAKLGPEATAEFVDPDKAKAVGGEGEEAKVGDAEPAEKQKGKKRRGKKRSGKKKRDRKANAAKKAAADEQADAAKETGETPSEDEPADADAETDPSDASLVAGALRFRSIGPALMSGRIGDVAVDQRNPNHWYVAAASGGLWKTMNAGTTFEPIFDDQSSYSMGCVTIDPTDHGTVWLGTGENNGGRHIGFGDGIYRSRDAGKSWKNMGLKETERISKIVVDPRNNDVVFAAAQGPLWSPGGERGLFKTTDGGKTWKNVLSAGEWTGVTDVVIDPDDPDTLYAATYQRHRTLAALLATGPESGVHKSTDGGETWAKLGGGLPGGDLGKISLAVSPQKSNVVYATIELNGREGGFWRSADHGASWAKTSDFVSGGTGPHYYQELWADPHRYGVLYQANNYFSRSDDDGETWGSVEGRHKHVDNHAVAFHPTDPDFLLVGCDGGVYRTYDYCETWLFCANLPLTQFYKVAVDYDWPFYHVAGGTQDNNSQYGPSRTAKAQGVTNADWRITIGGDGHDTAIDPENPDVIYAESQKEYVSRFDRKTGESVNIQPQPDAGEARYRFNWDTPIEISPHDHERIYVASQFLHRSDDRGDSWTKISPDLSRDRNRYKMPTMGRVQSVDAGYDLYAMSQHSNITSVDESPVVGGLLYVGTDDGQIHVSEDGGENWATTENIFGVPEYYFVNDVKADRHDADVVYACVDDHKTGDFSPYVLKSTDRGRNWSLISGGLPDRHVCWRIIQDHETPGLMFLATEFGVFMTLDGGEGWTKIEGGVPTISFRDLEIQRRENDLVAASFGRSFYILDDYGWVRDATAENLKKPFHMFPVRRAFWHERDDRLGGLKGSQGDSYFNAPNPDYGAVLRYSVTEEFESLKDKRKEREAAANKAGEDAPVPTFEELEAEEREVPPRYFVKIADESGTVVATLDLPGGKGIQKTVWRMSVEGIGPNRRGGPLAAPGAYTATAYQESDGEATEIGEPVTFELESIFEPTLPRQDRDEVLALLREWGQFLNKSSAVTQTLEDRRDQIDDLIRLLRSHPSGTPALLAEARALKNRMADFDTKLNGDDRKAEKWVLAEPGINGRLRTAFYGASRGTHGPTKTHREQWEIATSRFEEIEDELVTLLDEELEAFEDELDEAGLPWTNGRDIAAGLEEEDEE